MSKPKRLAADTTPEKSRPDKPFVQVEGELTEAQLDAIAGSQPSFFVSGVVSEAQLEAIADGLMKLTTLYTNFKEVLISKQLLISALTSARSASLISIPFQIPLKDLRGCEGTTTKSRLS